MSSYYAEAEQGWNDVVTPDNSDAEQICMRCRGTGSDRDGADCVPCEGYGSTVNPYIL